MNKYSLHKKERKTNKSMLHASIDKEKISRQNLHNTKKITWHNKKHVRQHVAQVTNFYSNNSLETFLEKHVQFETFFQMF